MMPVLRPKKKTKHVGEREKKRELTPLPLLTVGWLEKAPNFIAIVNVYIDAMGGGERKNHHHVHFTFIHLEKIFTFLTHFSDALFTLCRSNIISLENMLSNASILRKAATTAIRRSMATDGTLHFSQRW
jgi:hypothetical protein